MGGSCTCPNGDVYQVGDNWDGGWSLRCEGGTPGKVNYEKGAWSGRSVKCAPLVDEKECEDYPEMFMNEDEKKERKEDKKREESRQKEENEDPERRSQVEDKMKDFMKNDQSGKVKDFKDSYEEYSEMEEDFEDKMKDMPEMKDRMKKWSKGEIEELSEDDKMKMKDMGCEDDCEDTMKKKRETMSGMKGELEKFVEGDENMKKYKEEMGDEMMEKRFTNAFRSMLEEDCKTEKSGKKDKRKKMRDYMME